MDSLIKRISALDEDSLLKLENFLDRLKEKENVVPSFSSQISSSDGIHIYTDGGCVRGKGAFAWVIPNGQQKSVLIEGRTTNNVAELMAIQDAIESTPREIPLTIFSDSSYAINCVSVWHKKWSENDWKKANGSPVKNKDLIEGIVQSTKGRKVTFVHVAGHSGNKWNEIADNLCTELIRS